MIRKPLYLFILIVFFNSCKTIKKNTRKTTNTPHRSISVKASSRVKASKKAPQRRYKTPSKADNVINTALGYSGVKYKYGGTSHKGMDCSGLLYTAFNKHNVSLPRVSYVMAEEGKRIPIKNVEKGDLLFFKTNKKGRRINHVGLVVAVENNAIKFIHSTSSRGVIVSSLKEGYWNYAFVKATRVLN